MVIYEPVLTEESFFNSQVIGNLDEFKRMADIVVANRLSDDIQDIRSKVYTRDLFGQD